MSIHSLDHDSVLTDRGYKGYHIDKTGEVTEFYDHRSEEPPPSSIVTARQPLVNGSSAVKSAAPAKRRVRYRDAGCCDSCVNGLTWIGTLPLATAFALLISWIGTAMFIGAGWTALDESLLLFSKYGPFEGNPATDPAPQYIYTGGTGDFTSGFVLMNSENLGNRVPQVFEALKYSFYGIIPFMIIFTILLVCDNHRTSKALGRKRRSTSAGICFTSSLIAGTYILILAWIFFLAFTTLGVYYYRITMLRCSDLTERGFTPGVLSSICIDLVQLGLIMFRNTNDPGFGKICGPGTGDTMRSFGQLQEYCDNYYLVYQCMLVCFAGCLLIIIAMINFLMILTSNYNNLTRKYSRPYRNDAPSSVASPSNRSTPAPASIPTRSVANSTVTGPPPYVVPSQPRDYRDRRSSKDIELDYIIDDNSTVDRHREMDSHMGVNYYYNRR
uniref:Neuronal membrane glycoprotein M6-a n=1 Tax=Phallusia mammillata TaxID=59560 RepID=A0A6F9DDW4_9ASCI|nr:neuronal membrane glycoprotein M6-a [Phallusia mammillata]